MSVVDRASEALTVLADVHSWLGEYNNPDTVQPPVAELLDLVAFLRLIADKCKETLGDAELVALDAMDGQPVEHDGQLWKQDWRTTKQWDADKARDLVDRAKLTIARKVSRNPLTGELEEDRARVAMEALAELDRWQTLSARSIKTSTLKAEGIALDDYAEVTRSAVLKATPL